MMTGTPMLIQPTAMPFQVQENTLLPANTGSQIHIPAPRGSKGQENLAVARLLTERNHGLMQAKEQATAKAQVIRRQWKEAVLSLVGAENWQRFMEFSRRQRSTHHGLGLASQDREGHARLAAAKEAAKREALALLQAANVRPGDLQQLNRRFSLLLKEVLRTDRPGKNTLEQVTEDQVPTAVRAAKDTRNGLADSSASIQSISGARQPPYDGWSWAYSWYADAGYMDELTTYLNSNTGSVGHRSQFSNYNTSDFSYFSLWHDSTVGFWVWSDHAAPVDIWLAARSVSSTYDVWLDDEWGWSDSYTSMDSQLTLNFTSSLQDEVHTQAWRTEITGSPDSTTYAGNVLSIGGLYWYHLTTAFPIPGNAWTYVSVGAYDSRWSTLNDVSTRQAMRDQWYLEYVWYQVL